MTTLRRYQSNPSNLLTALSDFNLLIELATVGEGKKRNTIA